MTSKRVPSFPIHSLSLSLHFDQFFSLYSSSFYLISLSLILDFLSFVPVLPESLMSTHAVALCRSLQRTQGRRSRVVLGSRRRRTDCPGMRNLQTPGTSEFGTRQMEAGAMYRVKLILPSEERSLHQVLTDSHPLIAGRFFPPTKLSRFFITCTFLLRFALCLFLLFANLLKYFKDIGTLENKKVPNEEMDYFVGSFCQ